MKIVTKYVLLLSCCMAIFSQIAAQKPDSLFLKSNLHSKTIPIKDSLILDSLSIAPGSFTIQGISDSNYILYPERALLLWKHRPLKDSAIVHYRTLSLALSARHQHKTLALIDSNIAFPFRSYSGEADGTENNFVDFKGLEYHGTYGRSLTAGNQQDVSLNSNFDLQLNGYILDSIRIEAALSDNNIPFQPEGNTQRIQEFDKIYVTFEKNAHRLTAGDYEIKTPDDYFMKFNKRVQGLFYQGSFSKNKKIQNKVGLSASVAKGDFARDIFQGQEGNQGPYKLKGNNGEQFFIVLAGSEKVYIDGILMQRGEDLDYTIDYNTAEITFMPREMITKDSRIQVEFEYQVRNYLNSLLYAYDELDINKKWHFKFHAYSNQDSKNQSFQQSLTGQQKRFLRGIGDNIDEANYPNIRVDTFSENKILYRLKDSIINGQFYDSIFVYSINKDSTLYSLGFSYVGENKGNYQISSSNTNGRVYSWVAPVNGQPQGNFAPYVLIITPKKQQMFTLAGSYNIDSLKELGLELGTSNYSPNLFSTENNAQHWGFAGRIFYNGKRYFGKKDSTGIQNWQWHNGVNFERTQGRFKAISPFRNVEFDRDWNLNAYDSTNSKNQNLNNDEQLINFNTGLTRKNWGSLTYQISQYQKGKLFKANRNILTLAVHHDLYKGGATFNLMHSNNPIQKSNYLRPSAFIERRFPKIADLTIGSKWEMEDNKLINLNTNQLSLAAFSYNTLSFYLKNDEEKKTHFSFQYDLRKDKIPDGLNFKPQSAAQNIKAKLNLKEWKGQQIQLTGAFRILDTKDSSQINSTDGGTKLLGRLQYIGNILQNFIVPITLYEIGSGQQQKQAFIYVKVPVGQGNYMWEDYNHDGVQQSNEFETAIYPDQKQYIRILSPTNNYVQVNYVNLSQSLSIRPENLWKKSKKTSLQKFINRFSNQFTLQIYNKSLADGGLNGFNPFTQNIRDEDIVSNSSSLNNILYFNQLSSIWSINYSYIYQSGKTLLTYGLISQERKQNTLSARLVFLKNFTANLDLRKGQRAYQSAVPDDGRTYDFKEYNIHPELTWLTKSRLRIRTGYHWQSRQNRFDFGGEIAKIQSLELNIRLSFRKTGNINLTGTYTNIHFDGEDNSALSFAMLDALKKGQNWLWHLSWDRNIGSGLQISLEYDGRKSEGAHIIHTGTMSIRALL